MGPSLSDRGLGSGRSVEWGVPVPLGPSGLLDSWYEGGVSDCEFSIGLRASSSLCVRACLKHNDKLYISGIELSDTRGILTRLDSRVFQTATRRMARDTRNQNQAEGSGFFESNILLCFGFLWYEMSQESSPL